MPDSYYVSGPERSHKVRELFSRVASRYDLINDIQSLGLHRVWKNQLVRWADIQRTHLALDLCTGTGDIAIRLAERGASVVGCDFTPAMLARARRRAPDLVWVTGDALRLPFGNDTFDVMTIAYGLRNLADFQAGLSEMLRVLKPGGTLLVLEFGVPSNSIWRILYFTYLRVVVPLFGLIFCRDSAAYSYILDSLLKYPGQQQIARILRSLGCRTVVVRDILGGVMSATRALK